MESVSNSLFQLVTPIFPKKENCTFNFPIYEPSSYFPGNVIHSSRKWIVWISDKDGFKVVPLTSSYSILEKQHVFGFVRPHQSSLTNVQFSPFKENYLMTSSLDRYVKFWGIDKEEEKVKRIGFIDMKDEVLFSEFHPTVENFVTGVCKGGKVNFADSKNTIYNEVDTNIGDDEFSSMNWKKDGSVLSLLTRKGLFLTVDPRKKSIVETFNTDLIDGRVIWTENKNSVLLFGKRTENNWVEVRDPRNLKNSLNSLNLGNSKGDILPYYDNDTGLIICSYKNQRTCNVARLDEESNISSIKELTLTEPTISFTAAPKCSLNVMSAEIVRFIQLNPKGISPYSFSVPSKDYSKFREDLFPDTSAGEAAISLDEWQKGSNKTLNKVSLKPTTSSDNKMTTNDEISKLESTMSNTNISDANSSMSDLTDFDYDKGNGYKLDMEKYSKFRYIDAKPYPKTTNFKAFNQIFISTSGESSGVACVKNTLVVPLSGRGGKLGVLKLSNPHRIPSTGPFNVENGGVVNDFVLDPFDEQMLVAVCENSKINVWKIPENGLTESTTTPLNVMEGHKSRATFLKYHQMAKNVVASADIVGTIKLWDLDQGTSPMHCTNDTKSQITSMSWEPNGSSIVSTAMDKKFYIFDPRNGNASVKSAICSQAPVGTKIEWIDDRLLLISTLRADGRQVLKKIDLRNPDKTLAELVGDGSPSPYILFYDRDINVAFGFNKGGNTIQPIELRDDGCGFFLCDPFKSFSPHQTVAFLRKDALNVRNIEIAKSIRILDNTTELVQHKLLRSNEEYFQDDIFPPTFEAWKPSMTAADWFSGKNIPLNKVSLAPNNMIPLSQAKDLLVPATKKYNSRTELENATLSSDDSSNVISQFMGKVGEHRKEGIPQDLVEGLSDSEWND